MNRRVFLRSAILTGLGLTMDGRSQCSDASELIADSKKALVTSLDLLKNTTSASALQNRIHDAVCRLTGKEAARDAWRELFPAGCRVGIKLNATTPPAFARPETIALLLEGLKLAGIKNERIIIWERFSNDLKMSGWQKPLFDPAIRVLATEPEGLFDPELKFHTTEDTPAERDSGGEYSQISAILTREVDRCINVGAAKDHISAGVTLGLKSLTFGVMDNTRRFHAAPLCCDPAIPQCWSLPGVGEKVALSVIDAIHTIYNGGPFYHKQWCVQTDRLLLSLDAVALDRVTADFIDALRIEEGFRPVMETGRPCRHIFSAAAAGLGIADRRQIEVVEV